jgi:hypothetical protein
MTFVQDTEAPGLSADPVQTPSDLVPEARP